MVCEEIVQLKYFSSEAAAEAATAAAAFVINVDESKKKIYLHYLKSFSSLKRCPVDISESNINFKFCHKDSNIRSVNKLTLSIIIFVWHIFYIDLR